MQTFIGFNKDALAYNRTYSILEVTPGIVVRKHAFVSPIWASIEGNLLEELAGGAFEQAGRLIDEVAQPRSDGRNAIRLGQTVVPPAVAATRIPKAVFGGVAFDHFGHFLLEATARLWCLDQFKGLPWLFLTEGMPSMKNYQREFLMLLGLAAEQIVPVSEWHQIDELIIPEPSFFYHHQASQAYRDTFRRSRLPTMHAGHRVFLSRTNTTIALTVGERELESILAGSGWDIVSPETLPAAQQAALFRDDNIILGLQGSAMHLGLFAPAGRRVVHLCRGLGYRAYYLLDDLTDANATYLNAMRDHRLESKPIRGPFLLDLDRTVRFLRDQELIGAAPVAGRLTDDRPTLSSEALDTQYVAWWHYIESQIRFHHLIGHDGNAVEQKSALDSALQAVAANRHNRTMLSHAAGLLLKFEGVEAASGLIEQSGQIITHAETTEDAELLYYMSLIRDGRSDYVGALAAAEAAVARVPDNAGYVNQLATVLFRLDRLDEAAAVLHKIIEAGSALSGNYFMLSVVARAHHDEDAAIVWAQQAVKADRRDEGACRHLANLFNANNRASEALAIYQSFLERRPDSPAIINDALVLAQGLRDLEAATTLCLAAYRLDPDNSTLARCCTDILFEAGRLPVLTALDTPAATAVQEQAVMIYRHSVSLAETGAIEQALQVAKIAAELTPANTTIMSHLLGLMVVASRATDARLLANLLIDRGAESGALYYVLSLVEASLGFAERAKRAAGRAVELDPANAEIFEHYRRIKALKTPPC